ncbi:EamA/RhaT family transporter [Caulobacter sp. KR2-114]|uniref:EamA/RhaT family transporter n=1 Tax=Caulobacter sp. KR2-114 TaxID=3400912 RepID=UPI003C089CBC
MSLVWVPVTIGAASLQVARNALQRGLLTGAGPWGATLVRFLFGLPFSALFAAVAWSLTAHPAPHFATGFWLACALGGAAQITATAAMLVSMRRSTFALGTAFQQSSIPLAAVMGLVLGEPLRAGAWAGIGLVTAGLFALAWPRGRETPRDWSAALLGLVAGAGFALSSNAYRQAALTLDHAHPVLAAQITVFTVQAMQSSVLSAWLAARDRRALWVAVTSVRSSLPAGFFGAAASGLWFTAFALSPAGPVRAVGVCEMPIAALAGRRLFAERLSTAQIGAALVVAAGVVLAAVG